MIEIQFEKPNSEVCQCCGNESVRLTRFVYKNADAHAVYYCQITKEHEEKVVSGIISLGDWSEGSYPINRVAFPFRIWVSEENYQIGLLDKKDSHWSHIEFLGNILDRDAGLKHPWIKEVFHITDHIVTEDGPVIYFLNS
jgi:hypothetical protein